MQEGAWCTRAPTLWAYRCASASRVFARRLTGFSQPPSPPSYARHMQALHWHLITAQGVRSPYCKKACRFDAVLSSRPDTFRNRRDCQSTHPEGVRPTLPHSGRAGSLPKRLLAAKHRGDHRIRHTNDIQSHNLMSALPKYCSVTLSAAQLQKIVWQRYLHAGGFRKPHSTTSTLPQMN